MGWCGLYLCAYMQIWIWRNSWWAASHTHKAKCPLIIYAFHSNSCCVKEDSQHSILVAPQSPLAHFWRTVRLSISWRLSAPIPRTSEVGPDRQINFSCQTDIRWIVRANRLFQQNERLRRCWFRGTRIRTWGGIETGFGRIGAMWDPFLRSYC